MRQRITAWGLDIWGGFTSIFCWFTPAHCDEMSKIFAFFIGGLTLFGMTIPRLLGFPIGWGIHRFFKCKKR